MEVEDPTEPEDEDVPAMLTRTRERRMTAIISAQSPVVEMKKWPDLLTSKYVSYI